MNDIEKQIEKLKDKIVENYRKSIDVGPGWYQLVLDCDKELYSIDPHYAIYQVKEKFGTLRYYAKCSSRMPVDLAPKMQEVINKYEKLSASICEVTGKPGVLMKSVSGWYKTLSVECDECGDIFSSYSEVKGNDCRGCNRSE